MFQRIREISVQLASGLNSGENRYEGIFQVGPDSNQTISFSMAKVGSSNSVDLFVNSDFTMSGLSDYSITPQVLVTTLSITNMDHG